MGSGHGEGQAQGRSGLLPAAHRWFVGGGREGDGACSEFFL